MVITIPRRPVSAPASGRAAHLTRSSRGGPRIRSSLNSIGSASSAGRPTRPARDKLTLAAATATAAAAVPHGRRERGSRGNVTRGARYGGRHPRQIPSSLLSAARPATVAAAAHHPSPIRRVITQMLDVTARMPTVAYGRTHKPALMDVVLDAMALGTGAGAETPAIVSVDGTIGRVYDFLDQTELDEYWREQERMVCTRPPPGKPLAMWHLDDVSCERSTAAWTPRLDGDYFESEFESEENADDRWP